MQERCHDAGHKVFLAMTCFCRGGDMQPAHTLRRGPLTAPNTIRPCRRLLLSRSPPGKAHTFKRWSASSSPWTQSVRPSTVVSLEVAGLLAHQAQQQVLAVDVVARVYAET